MTDLSHVAACCRRARAAGIAGLVAALMAGCGAAPENGPTPVALRNSAPSPAVTTPAATTATALATTGEVADSSARLLANAGRLLRAAAGSAGRTSLAVPAESGTGKRIVYAKGQQRVWLVEATGQVASTYVVSGLMTQPDPGRYAVYSKSRNANSAVEPPATMRNMVRFARGKATGAAIGFHDIPQLLDGRYEQTEAQLGQPISAGCIRQKRSDSEKLWGFAPVGTPVVVVA